MKTCPTCFGFGHLGKPDNKQCPKCEGAGTITHKPRKAITYAESKEQLTIASYIKKHYPNIPVETVKHEGKKKHWEQNQHAALNTQDSFPDTRIYLPNITLMLENKAIGKPPANLNGKLIDMHHQNQYNTHRRLFSGHTKVYFAVGVSEAIEIFEDAVKGIYRPMQIYKDCAALEKNNSLADAFFNK